MQIHPLIREQLIDALEKGMTLKRAADLIGYPIEDLRAEMIEDRLLSLEVQQAKARLEFVLLGRLIEAAQWQASRFLLQSLYPQRYHASRKRKPRPRAAPDRSNEQRLAKLTVEELRVIHPLLEKMEDDGDPKHYPDGAGGRESQLREEPP